MASITIRRLDDALKARLRIRAARQGRSMEEEARRILKAGLIEETMRRPNLAESIRRRMAPIDAGSIRRDRSEEHTSELQSHSDLVCRLLLEKKKSGSDGGQSL